MALTKETLNDKKEVNTDVTWNYSYVNVRTATVIKEDGVVISESFSRKAIMPDADYSQEDADVRAICDLEFTQQCKDNYAAAKAATDGQ